MKGWPYNRWPYACRLATALLLLAVLLWAVPLQATASPLAISSVQAGNVTETSATVTWDTDDLGNSTVNYGNTTSLGLTATDASFVTTHAVLLGGLEPGTTYYYEAQSANQAGNETITDNNGGAYYVFTTVESDTTPPAISGVQASNITTTSATIGWSTDEASDSVVNYGNTTMLGTTASDAGLVTGHSVALSGLDPGTTYYYEVESTDGANNTATDDNGGSFYSFSTLVPDTTPPVISGVHATGVTSSSATVAWSTDEPSDSVVRFGPTTALGSSASDASMVTGHSVLLMGLNPGATYYYEVQSTDGANNTAVDDNAGAYYSFTTTPLDSVPPVIGSVQATSIAATSVRITWTTDEASNSVVNYGDTTSLGSTKSDANMVTSHSVWIGSLDPGTTYHFEVRSTDASSNMAVDNNTGAYYSFTTSETSSSPVSITDALVSLLIALVSLLDAVLAPLVDLGASQPLTEMGLFNVELIGEMVVALVDRLAYLVEVFSTVVKI
jgi:hypothetical protein